MNPAKVQLIQPPITIMGSTLVKVPFIISNAMFGSVGGGWGDVCVCVGGGEGGLSLYM